jgi:Domain of unknown function (DUF2828)
MNRNLRAINNVTRTENGAPTLKSSLNANLDYYANAGAARGRDTTDLFRKALQEDPTLAMRNLFHLRDIRGGKGERATFRKHLDYLYRTDRSLFHAIVGFIPEYGRWDDMLAYHNEPSIVALVRSTLVHDAKSEKPTLLAKWMPSENASSAETKALARAWMTALGYTAPAYRRLLSMLRNKLRIVERSMSAKEWESIVYASVPSKAMTNYRKAFSKHDPDGFAAYMEKVKKGEVKINASTLFPYELFDRLRNSQDEVLEVQWSALPVYIPEGKSFLVCPDVSGSMTTGSASASPISMSVSLAVYCSQFAKGAFKDKVLSFTDKPTLYDLSRHRTVYDKFREVMSHVGYDTNLMGMFRAIVDAGKKYNVPQENMPDYLLIITDMEFNDPHCKMTNLEAAKKLFKEAGYIPPIIVFWNVDSRQNQVGALDTDKGVILVSGASAAILKGALTGNTVNPPTPVESMLEILNSERYEKIVA